MIEIEVRLYATLRQYLPRQTQGTLGGELSLTLEEGTTLRKLEELLGIPAGVTKTTFVNGHIRESDYVLQDKDEVAIFPPVAGG